MKRTLAAALATAAFGLGSGATAEEASAVVPPEVQAHADELGPIEHLAVFTGDFTGDGADDAVAFIYYAAQGGNAVYLDLSLFESVDGRLAYLRSVDDVFGMSPREVSISPGRIEVTTTVLKPGEPRCCPTGEERYTITP